MKKTKIDKLIDKIRNGKQVLQFMEFDRSYYIVFLADSFFIESYKFNKETKKDELFGVECIDEETARFALTARY